MVAQSCKAVIACRARKDQKAKLTRLVRKGNREVVTLGVGDGANDVEMIRAAHIGVGIIGKEGTQAVNNADYAISQFRYLTRLILVYGHHEYRGITLAALLIFDCAPVLLNIVSNFLGIYAPVNMIFFLGFCFSLLIIFSLTVALSRLSAGCRARATSPTPPSSGITRRSPPSVRCCSPCSTRT